MINQSDGDEEVGEFGAGHGFVSGVVGGGVSRGEGHFLFEGSGSRQEVAAATPDLAKSLDSDEDGPRRGFALRREGGSPHLALNRLMGKCDELLI